MAAHSFEDLKNHRGHAIECVIYGDDASAAVECLDCREVILSFDNSEECPEWAVWVLTILHRHGSDQYVFQDKDTAERQLYLYVYENWVDRFPTTPCPDTAKSRFAIREYFFGNDDESYTLIETPVRCEVEP